MVTLEVVARAGEQEQHQVDTEGLCLHDGRVFTCADDGKVKVYDHQDLSLVQEVQAHDYCVNDVAVAGGSLYTASVDCTVRCWDPATLAPRGVLTTHKDAVRKIATNGTHLFTGDDGGEVRVHGLDGSPKGCYSLVEEVWGIAATADLLFTVRDRGITVSSWKEEVREVSTVTSVEGRAPLLLLQEHLVAADPAGTCLVVRDNARGSFKTQGLLKGPEMIVTAVGGSGGRVVSGGWDNLARLYDLASLAQLASCPLPGCPAALAMAPDGCIFATGAGGYVCKLKAT